MVTALTEDVLMPAIGFVTGGIDSSDRFLILSRVPESYTGSLHDYAALKPAAVTVIGSGSLLTAAVNFLIMAFILFLLVNFAHRLMPEKKVAPSGPGEVELLGDIRDQFVQANARAEPGAYRGPDGGAPKFR
ncbi:MAG TPA: MscL family protein [Sphingobium sp.]|nr:MscL family protein [Sphingobium sp.]